MTTFTRTYILGIALFVASVFSTPAYSMFYDFNVTYDGSSPSMDAGSDNPIGTVLQVGDDFNYNLHAAGDDYWNVDVGGSFFPFLAFTIEESGDRTGNMSLSLFLDGVLQAPILVENGIFNSQVHLGTNAVSLNTGLMFDEILLTYELLTSFEPDTSIVTATTIADYSIGPNLPGGFGDGISYVSAVPIPGAAWLFGSGLLGLVGMARRKKA